MDTDIKTERKRLIALIHIGKRELGMSNEEYQVMLTSAGGRPSCTEMSLANLQAIIKAMKQAGFTPRPARGNRPYEQVVGNAGKITKRQAYYIQGLWQLVSRQKSSESLEMFIGRVSKVDALRFLNRDQASNVIVALKQITRKAGYDPDSARGRMNKKIGGKL